MRRNNTHFPVEVKFLPNTRKKKYFLFLLLSARPNQYTTSWIGANGRPHRNNGGRNNARGHGRNAVRGNGENAARGNGRTIARGNGRRNGGGSNRQGSRRPGGHQPQRPQEVCRHWMRGNCNMETK